MAPVNNHTSVTVHQVPGLIPSLEVLIIGRYCVKNVILNRARTDQTIVISRDIESSVLRELRISGVVQTWDDNKREWLQRDVNWEIDVTGLDRLVVRDDTFGADSTVDHKHARVNRGVEKGSGLSESSANVNPSDPSNGNVPAARASSSRMPMAKKVGTYTGRRSNSHGGGSSMVGGSRTDRKGKARAVEEEDEEDVIEILD
ncbi:hypothetical protein FRC03_006842 [Tulasnella sp. 419]|nr:hypothetical protein FRC02_009371 [Tulasnella sp. 418]KAG8960266.1 hypothetical protein FRC03_006842 [Tulasnella sp. 419]